MRTLLLVLLFVPLVGWGQDLTLITNWLEDTRTYSDSTGKYLVHFRYNTEYASVPLTYPPGQPHYAAIITVFKIEDGDTVQIGEPFDGEYTENGCFEDALDYLVRKAKKEPAPKPPFNLSSTNVLIADTTGILQTEAIFWPDFMTYQSFLSLWREYKDSCWADMRLDTVWNPTGDTSMDLNSTANLVCFLFNPPDSVIFRRNDEGWVWYGRIRWLRPTPTFPGFMEFLEKRYK